MLHPDYNCFCTFAVILTGVPKIDVTVEEEEKIQEVMEATRGAEGIEVEEAAAVAQTPLTQSEVARIGSRLQWVFYELLLS